MGYEKKTVLSIRFWSHWVLAVLLFPDATAGQRNQQQKEEFELHRADPEDQNSDQEVSRGFEPRSLDSESRVLTVTP